MVFAISTTTTLYATKTRAGNHNIISIIGFGSIVGFLVGFTLKRIMKILPVIAGVFFRSFVFRVSAGQFKLF